MRAFMGYAVIMGLALVGTAAAQRNGGKPATVDKELLVGKWSTGTIRGVKGPVREFTNDGKCYIGSGNGKGPRLEGTYELDGDNLTMTMGGAEGVPADVQKFRVKKLTRTELVLVAGRLTESLRKAK